MLLLQDQSWAALAACASSSPDDLFVQGAAQRSARAVCFGCTVRMMCLADALDNRVPFGVWGGMTERERRALLRRQPDVASWRALLASDDGVDGPVAEFLVLKPLRGSRSTAPKPASVAAKPGPDAHVGAATPGPSRD